MSESFYPQNRQPKSKNCERLHSLSGPAVAFPSFEDCNEAGSGGLLVAGELQKTGLGWLWGRRRMPSADWG
jgi:hypothetical protein